jgi:hypothetical protein
VYLTGSRGMSTSPLEIDTGYAGKKAPSSQLVWVFRRGASDSATRRLGVPQWLDGRNESRGRWLEEAPGWPGLVGSVVDDGQEYNGRVG